MNKTRCPWASDTFDLYIRYHDEEWGVPVHDDRVHFEFLILEGAQAGLSWSTILKKREGYRESFAGFDPEKVATFGEADVERLVKNEGIVRHELKIRSAITNAAAFLKVADEFGSFDRYIWNFTDGEPIQNSWRSLSDVPAQTPLSETISRDLKNRGFKFVGPTIIYAYMQAVGLVNDHTTDCFRHSEVKALAG